MTTDAQWRELGDTAFVALTTYRRTGVPVTTPVWIAPDGDDLVVTTTSATGKAKRLRNDPRVRLQPCSRSGAIAPDAIAVDAHGVIAGPVSTQAAAERALRRKYGVQFRAFRAIAGTARRLRRRPDLGIILRISRG